MFSDNNSVKFDFAFLSLYWKAIPCLPTGFDMINTSFLYDMH